MGGEIPTPPRRSGGSGRNVTAETTSTRRPETLDRVVIRFAGDSGDGMQLAGDRFTDVSAAFGNDLATLPNFPAEIRAPAGTIAGVSSFQVHISDHEISTPGDSPNVRVAMNPAALTANLRDMTPGSTLLGNIDAVDTRNPDNAAFRAGFNFGETAELFDHPYEVKPAQLAPGTYRNVTGNVALSYGLVAAAQQAKLPIFYASYPITPASDILHELSKLKNFGVKTLQAEDEIAAAGAAVGAAFAGSLAVTATSGPGVDLKAETIGLAISLELPMVLVDVQRGGTSTGLPTKTEQADLMLAMYGRHGESPLPIVAAQSPSDCFDAAFESVRIALKYRTPVILLTDGYLANAAEPWNLPDLEALPDIPVPYATEFNHGDDYWPYLREPETLARPWAIPGTPGLMHRVGGLEKEDGTGNVSYDPENHDQMKIGR